MYDNMSYFNRALILTTKGDIQMQTYKIFETFIGEDNLPVKVTYWPYNDWELGFQFTSIKTGNHSIIDLLDKATLDLLAQRTKAHEYSQSLENNN